MSVLLNLRTLETRLWCVVVAVMAAVIVDVTSLNGPNVCMVKQKYNITKRVKYRAPMSVRTYEWCFSMPPRCSKWSTEMRDLTRLETEERTAEVAVCCPGYKMQHVSCIPICPYGKTGIDCSEDCPPSKWGPNCVNDCKNCSNTRVCSSITGECQCKDGWQGESCEERMTTSTVSTTILEDLLTTSVPTTKSPPALIKIRIPSTTFTNTVFETSTSPITKPMTTTSYSTSNFITIFSPAPEEKEINKEKVKKIVTPLTPMEMTPMFNNNNSVTTIQPTTMENNLTIQHDVSKTYYNRTEAPADITNETFINIEANFNKTEPTVASTTEIKSTEMFTSTSSPKTTTDIITTEKVIKSTTAFIQQVSNKEKVTQQPDTTLKFYPTTLKFKPKEIWIRPAQKGEHLFIEPKTKEIHDSQLKYKNTTKKDIVPENTTPRTIIVSIIPTSVSYSTFKKIALTTASYLSQKSNATYSYNKTTEGSKKLFSVHGSTTAPFTIKILNTKSKSSKKFRTLTTNSLLPSSVTNSSTTTAAFAIEGFSKQPKTATSNNPSNSMTTLNTVNTKMNFSNIVTTTSATNVPNTFKGLLSVETESSEKNSPMTTNLKITQSTKERTSTESTMIHKHFETDQQKKVTRKFKIKNTEFFDIPLTTKNIAEPVEKTNATKIILTNITNIVATTDVPSDEETFHILTEPEHITAVMGEKENEKSSVDLISVISIAGGIMMAVITVAVVIVMIERCKRPRYEDVRKGNDIRMQVLIENNDTPPPPYVKSIFHTPLPDPPTAEICHYQPISTLDRNLKQFMRPVVVQTISPIMLENFRGILECHYDHLPRRSHDCCDFDRMQNCCSLATSVNKSNELQRQQRLSVAESTIEALKCEAKLDVIDSTTSEPLYAEIPCWRPPSEHAIEIVNINGEAITEL